MREELQKRSGYRGVFRARFIRFGQKSVYKGPPLQTALFYDITDASGEVLTDHLWFTVYKQMGALNLQPQDLVSFAARVTPYWKGYRGRRDEEEGFRTKDYRLSHPTQFRIIERVIAVHADGLQMALTLL